MCGNYKVRGLPFLTTNKKWYFSVILSVHSISATNIANPIANPSVRTTYNVKIVNGACEKTETVLIEVSATQTTFELKAMAECGENGRVVFVNKVTDAKNYTWFLADGTEITKNAQEFDKSGEYELRLEFFNGTCRQGQIQKIKVETIKPANVITPNGDGKTISLCLTYSIRVGNLRFITVLVLCYFKQIVIKMIGELM